MIQTRVLDRFPVAQIVPGLNAMVGLKVLATEEWGFFLEGKYNHAAISNFANNS